MRASLELLLLHALPLDGSMWREQMELLPGTTHAPTLYRLGNCLEEWAAAVLRMTKGDRLVVVGCSVGGSCALEVAAAAPERVAALVLIGTKAKHHPDPALHTKALAMLEEGGMERTWRTLWAPLFSPSVGHRAIGEAERIALRQSPADVARGVTAFHTRASRDQILASLPCPVVLMTGEDDPVPGLRVNTAQTASAPHGRLEIIPECGHYVPLERPAALNATLRRLIAAMDRA